MQYVPTVATEESIQSRYYRVEKNVKLGLSDSQPGMIGCIVIDQNKIEFDGGPGCNIWMRDERLMLYI